METTKRNFSKVSGIIIVICALGMTVLNSATGKNMDSFIFPFILLMAGVLFLSQKPSETSRKTRMSPQKQKIVIATLSIGLMAGIATLMITLL